MQNLENEHIEDPDQNVENLPFKMVQRPKNKIQKQLKATKSNYQTMPKVSIPRPFK